MSPVCSSVPRSLSSVLRFPLASRTSFSILLPGPSPTFVGDGLFLLSHTHPASNALPLMSTPTPDPTSNPIVASAPAASIPAESAGEASAETGNLPLGILAGGIAALIGAALWAIITVTTEYQIGFMAVGVGYLVGAAVGKFGHGQTNTFRIAGAALALAGCVLGNFFTIIGFVSARQGLGFFEMLTHIDYTAIPGVMASAASPMDFLFYAIAIYEGYKLSVKS